MVLKLMIKKSFALRYPSSTAMRSVNLLFLLAVAALLLTGCARLEAFISQMNDDPHSVNADETSSPVEGSSGQDDSHGEEQDDSNREDNDDYPQNPDSDPVPEGVAVGDFASGFPVELFDLPSTCEILMTSVEADGEDAITFSANFQCEDSSKSLASHFTSELEAETFSTKDSKKPEGMSKYLVFTRESESMTIGILDDEDVRVVSLGGHLMQSVTPED